MDQEEPDGVLAMAWTVLAYMLAGVLIAVVATGLAVLTVRDSWRRWRRVSRGGSNRRR